MEPSGVREYGTGPWPVVALGVTLSLAVGYAEFHLCAAGLGPRVNRHVAGWTLVGSAFTAATSGLTILIRVAEGRVVEEPALDLPVSAAVGALAGGAVGRYAARATHEGASSSSNCRGASLLTPGRGTVDRSRDGDGRPRYTTRRWSVCGS